MNAKEFLKETRNWEQGQTGTFDLNGMVGVLEDYAKKLKHHYDTTVGLWATDRPDLVNDPKKMLFEIKG